MQHFLENLWTSYYINSITQIFARTLIIYRKIYVIFVNDKKAMRVNILPLWNNSEIQFYENIMTNTYHVFLMEFSATYVEIRGLFTTLASSPENVSRDKSDIKYTHHLNLFILT